MTESPAGLEEEEEGGDLLSTPPPLPERFGLLGSMQDSAELSSKMVAAGGSFMETA